MFNSDFDSEFTKREKRFNLEVRIAFIIFILFAIISSSVAQYNEFVDTNTKVEQYYSVIETTLQRRNDLIPNVVNSVKGYMAHEEKLLTEITNARKEIGKSEIENGSTLDNSISKLIALAESNPELRANENVNALIIELEGTENRIMVARQDYVKAVAEYNATIRKFPTSMFAKIFGFKEVQIFQATPESKTVPNVDLK